MGRLLRENDEDVDEEVVETKITLIDMVPYLDEAFDKVIAEMEKLKANHEEVIKYGGIDVCKYFDRCGEYNTSVICSLVKGHNHPECPNALRDREIERRLIGSAKVFDRYEYKKEWVREPFTQKGTVAYCFCENCLALIEVGIEQAGEFCRMSGIEELIDYSDLHFVVGFCPFCTWEEKYKSARVIRGQ